MTTDPIFYEALFGNAEGYAHFAVGRGAKTNGSGQYSFRAWESKAFLWPASADQALAYANSVLASHQPDDLYVCPNLLLTSARKKGTAVCRRLLHVDADDGVDPSRLAELRGFAVSSGTPSHAHIFVPLSEDVPRGQYDLLMNGVRNHFRGDNKISDNDLLRPVGSKNHKAAVLHGLDKPYVAEWLVKPPTKPLDPEAVARLLGLSLSRSDDSAGLHSETGQWGAEMPHQTPFDLLSFPAVAEAHATKTGDRSADTQRIVRAGFEAGLQISQIRSVVSQRDDLQERLDQREDDDVSRVFLKLADEAQQKKADSEAHVSKDDAFRGDVVKEIRRLRVREAARSELANERRGGDLSFDAGLLEQVLARPPEAPYRITGLLPSEGGMLVVAQRKTGKTTLTLNLARSLIAGELFLGRFPVRQVAGRVGVLNYEVSGGQFGMWAEQALVPVDRLFLVNLRGCRNPLTDPDDRKRLAGLLREHAVESLIVDPFSRAFGGSSQNDSGEVGAWLMDLDRFARTEVGVSDLILTTHAGWNGERTRGSSSLEDWADSVMLMTRDPKDEETRYLRAFGRDVYVEEDRLTFDQPTRTLTMTGSGSRKQNLKDAKAGDLLPHVVGHVAAHPGASRADVLSAMQMKRGRGELFAFQSNDVTQACRLAEKQGQLRIEAGGPGKAIRHFVIDLPPTSDGDPMSGDREAN